eukprot:GHVS01064204.1.p1 GENE.GHVS01064204.1~~GHVS01064204.1.p1  ORF type:complete len:239 (-),score=22.03 GHVS01064204.1:914-1630(-)
MFLYHSTAATNITTSVQTADGQINPSSNAPLANPQQPFNNAPPANQQQSYNAPPANQQQPYNNAPPANPQQSYYNAPPANPQQSYYNAPPANPQQSYYNAPPANPQQPGVVVNVPAANVPGADVPPAGGAKNQDDRLLQGLRDQLTKVEKDLEEVRSNQLGQRMITKHVHHAATDAAQEPTRNRPYLRHKTNGYSAAEPGQPCSTTNNDAERSKEYVRYFFNGALAINGWPSFQMEND